MLWLAIGLLLTIVTSIDSVYEESWSLVKNHDQSITMELGFSFQLSNMNKQDSWVEYGLVPKPIVEMMLLHPQMRFLEFSLANSVWDKKRWGQGKAVAPGAFLHGLFQDIPEEDAENIWIEVANVYSGLFSSAVNRVSKTGRRPDFVAAEDSFLNFYGMLLDETVCTENLSPFLKLLPYRSHHGVGALLSDPIEILGKNSKFSSFEVIVSSFHDASWINFTYTNVFEEIPHHLFEIAKELDPSLTLPQVVPVEDVPHWKIDSLLFKGPSFIMDPRSLRTRLTYTHPTSHSFSVFDIIQTLPFFVKPKLSTMAFTVEYLENGKTHQMEVNLPIVSRALTSSELTLVYRVDLEELGVDVSAIQMSFEFITGFLRTDEFPPDYNRGFDIPPVQMVPVGRPFDGQKPEIIFGNPLVITIPYPDLSMPFNVISFTSTALAYYFGGMFLKLYNHPTDMERKSFSLFRTFSSEVGSLKLRFKALKMWIMDQKKSEEEIRAEKAEAEKKANEKLLEKLERDRNRVFFFD